MFGARIATLFSLVVLSTLSPVDAAGVVKNCVKRGHAALTFDDGPYQYTRDATRILEAAGAKGTFFVNGKNWGCIYDQTNVDTLRHVYNGGHQIASHTWSHKDLTTLSASDLAKELKDSHVAIERITGASVAFMRPPYGNYNDNVVAAAGKLGETVTIWDFDSGDSVGVSVEDQKKRYTALAKQKPSSVLSLEHDVHESSIKEVLPFAIKELQRAGYKLVTVAECLGQQPYQKTGRPQSRTGDWHC